MVPDLPGDRMRTRPHNRRSRATVFLLAIIAVFQVTSCGEGWYERTRGIWAIVTWPPPLGGAPLDAQSVILVLQSIDTVTIDWKLSPRLADGGQDIVRFLGIPEGDYLLVAQAFERADGTGMMLAHAGIPVSLRRDRYTLVGIGLNAEYDRLDVTPASTSLRYGYDGIAPESIHLMAQGWCRDGGLVLVWPSRLMWSSADPDLVTVSSDGTVSAEFFTPGYSPAEPHDVEIAAIDLSTECRGTATMTLIPPPLPRAPQDLHVAAADWICQPALCILLQWSSPLEDGATSFRLYSSPNPGVEKDPEEYQTVSDSEIWIHATPRIFGGNTLYYAVSAVNVVGEGPLSEEIRIDPPEDPAD